MRARQTGRYIYNKEGKRIKLPLELEKEWESMRLLFHPELAERQAG